MPIPSSGERPPAISVVVPVYNSIGTIGATLEALAALAPEPEHEVIVVDGGSDDGTLELLRTAGDGFHLLHNPHREPASSRNLGARTATAPAIAFTDSDCVPTAGWLAAGLAALAGADIVQGKVLPAGAHGPFDRTVAVVGEYGLYETANLFVTRDVFERTGGFEPIPGLALPDGTHFGEDAWFVWRAKRLGARTAFSDDALVHHAVFPRGIGLFLTEIRRRRHFPRLVSLIPELRRTYLHHGYFLSPDSLRFDLAVAGLLVAGARRRPLALLAALPYARAVADGIAEFPSDRRRRILAGRVAADVLTFTALVRGSAGARTPVL